MIWDFIDNNVIRYLAPKPYWTVNVDGKKPLDIVEFERTGQIIGAKNETCLTDLDNLLRIINAIPQQFVYSLNAVRDKIVVLDVEKTCPDDIKETLLKLPFLYGDISMSGKGLHLVFPCPQLDETTVNKVVMKEEHGYYEILIHHYVTFTNNTLPPIYTTENAPIQFREIWDNLKASQKNLIKRDYDMCFENVSLDFPQYETLKTAVVNNFRQRFKKTPEDYHNDMSRYEFAVIGSIRRSLNIMLDIPMFARRIHLDEQQQILMIYQIVTEILPYREKHDETRDGKPLLLYQVMNSFATSAPAFARVKS